MGAPVLGREHGGGVGLAEQAVERNEFEGGLAGGLARIEKGGVEGEVGTECDELGDEFGGAAVGMEEKAAGRARVSAQEREEFAESLEAVDGGGAVERGGEGELGQEGRDLVGHGRPGDAGQARIVGAGGVEQPTVEADLADGGARIGEQAAMQLGQPVLGAGRAGIPRVDTVGGKDEGVGGGERGDARPVGRMSAVDHHACRGGGEGGPAGGDLIEMRREGLVLQVIMGVVEHAVGGLRWVEVNVKTRRVG